MRQAGAALARRAARGRDVCTATARGDFRFDVIHRSRRAGSRARVGRLTTPHGTVDTPAFVPVGTNAALKGIDERCAREAGVQLMFCNTYHLLVHPGADIVAQAGGLHAFMNHDGPLITDSGGFQMFSLSDPPKDGEETPELKSRSAKRRRTAFASEPPLLVRVNESGAVFRSYRTGELIDLTPESSIRAQKARLCCRCG